jgi:hypothetical protein
MVMLYGDERSTRLASSTAVRLGPICPSDMAPKISDQNTTST